MSANDYLSEDVIRWHLQQHTANVGLRSFCRQHDLDPGNVCNIINNGKPMMPSVAAALGYEQRIVYQKVRKTK